MKKITYILLLAFIFASLSIPLFSQTVEEVEKSERGIEKEKNLWDEIWKKKPAPEKEGPAIPPGEAVLAPQEQAMLNRIDVIGVTLIPEKEINRIIQPYLNRVVSAEEMRTVANEITAAYRKRGLVTSRAYLPPQRVDSGVLEIRVLEVATGNIEVRGNKYFKAKIYSNRTGLKKGKPFNYDTLRIGLREINLLPDRNVKAVLAPGKETGTTDVILEAQDRLPMHIGFDWDNYGSRFVDKDRIRTTLTHNNLLGLDDALTYQYQVSEGENYALSSARYLLPLTQHLKLGFFYADSKIDLRQEYEEENLNARGKSRIFSMYLTQLLMNKENFNFNFNLGFDYKNTYNFQGGIITSTDLMRVAKASLDADLTDSWGRTIINNEVSFGIPSVMGGLEKRDDLCSRSGAGGKFFKDTLGVLRLNRMPFNSTLLWKNQAQFSPDILTAAEQFQIGGIVNVRGYPAAEIVGDRGFSTTLELSMPVYPLPKGMKVPYSKAKLYDALRMILFYDLARAHLKRPTATEEKDKTLRAAGCGMRLILPENFSIKAEFAWPLDNTPSDGDHMHAWLEVSKSF